MSKVYTGMGRSFQEVTPLPMDEEALVDIGKRVKLQPHFLGEPLVVIAEAEDFNLESPSGTRGLVGLDTIGRAVSVSLASGMADVDSVMIALELSAQLNRLSPAELGKVARVFVGRMENETLLKAWEEHDVEMNEETVELLSLVASVFGRDAENYADRINCSQRIIVAAESYSMRLLRVLDWLSGSGVNTIGLRFRRYVVAGQEVYFAEQIAPAPDPAAEGLAGLGGVTPAMIEPSEPWKIKGRAYYADRLAPRAALLLDALLAATREHTFTVQWQHKHYFWIRGVRRNLRVRTYHRDRLELGFYSAAPAAVAEFLHPYGLDDLDVTTVGGYADSPFVVLPGESTVLDDRWLAMLADWLTGASPGRSLTSGPSDANERSAADSRSMTDSGIF